MLRPKKTSHTMQVAFLTFLKEKTSHMTLSRSSHVTNNREMQTSWIFFVGFCDDIKVYYLRYDYVCDFKM